MTKLSEDAWLCQVLVVVTVVVCFGWLGFALYENSKWLVVEQQRCEDRGAHDFKRGVPLIECPFPEPPRVDWWEDGWKKAKEQQ